MAESAVSIKVRTLAVTLGGEQKQLESRLNTHAIALKLLAEDLSKDGKEQEVATLLQSTNDIASMCTSLHHHSSALQTLAQSYNFTGQPTNFEEQLSGTVEGLREGDGPVEQHPLVAAFKAAMRSARATVQVGAGEGEEGEEEDEEDDIIMTSTDLNLVKNTKCPYTMRPVEELKEPVCCCDCRHIYEKAAVMPLLSGGGRKRVHCPVAGCKQYLQADRVVSDSELVMSLHELRIRREREVATAAAYGPAEDVEEL